MTGSKQLDGQALQSFLDALSEPAFLLDRDYRILAANRAFAEGIDASPADLLGQPAFRFISAEDGERRRPYLERVVATGCKEVFEDLREGRYFTNHIAPILDDTEAVVAIAVFAFDITEARIAQTSKLVSEARCQQIITCCLEGVWQIDKDNLTSFVNLQMATMLGYTVDEFMGRSMFDFMDEEAKQLASQNVERRRDGIAERHEFRFRHKLGHHVWTSLSTNPTYTSDGTYTGAVALATDISEARMLEQRIQQTQKLESLGLLAGGVAHDFNNLLVGILANIGIVQQALDPKAPSQDTLLDVKRAAEAAARLTDELLAYSGNGQFVTEPLNLADTVTEVANLLAKVISKKTRISVTLSTESPIILADDVQLRQVVMNLFTNASESLGDRTGTIQARISIASLNDEDIAKLHFNSQLETGEYICLEVQDTGEGMSEEIQARIFDPFFTTKVTGRGLGLAAVQGILRGHHAGLRIDSKVGVGSTIRIYFPRTACLPAKPETRVKTSSVTIGTGLVLVVDDEPMVRDTAAQILMLFGFEVLRCSNGEMALEHIAQRGHEFVAVLLDQTMPGLTGSEVFLRLRELQPNLPVVLTSGYSAKGISLTSSGLPASFLKKPFSIDQLRHAIFSAME